MNFSLIDIKSLKKYEATKIFKELELQIPKHGDLEFLRLTLIEQN